MLLPWHWVFLSMHRTRKKRKSAQRQSRSAARKKARKPARKIKLATRRKMNAAPRKKKQSDDLLIDQKSCLILRQLFFFISSCLAPLIFFPLKEWQEVALRCGCKYVDTRYGQPIKAPFCHISITYLAQNASF